MFTILKDVLFFLTKGRPYDKFYELNIKLLIYLYFIKVGFFLFLFLLNFFLFNLKIEGNVEGLHKQGFFIDLINILILAPILEEILFRFHLNLKLRNIVFSIIATCVMFYDHIWLLSVLIFYFSILILLPRFRERANNLIFVYLSAFFFGISHLAYKELLFSLEDILSYVYTFTPKFFSGLIYSYVFFKKGLYFSILLHFLWNLLPFIIDQLANSL